MTLRPRVELLRDLDRESGWVLLVDGVEQSYVDIVEPGHLEFEYMQHMALVLDTVLPAGQPARAVHLGGGAMTMPRWLATARPGSRQTVLESSAAVLEATAGLEPVPDCMVVVADALEAVATLPPQSFDLAVWDLYDGARAVLPALTQSALDAVVRVLRPDPGLFVLNVSDVTPFDIVRPVVAALRESCTDVAVLAEPATLRGRRSGNCVVAAVRSGSLPVARLSRRGAGAPARARVVAGDDLVGFVGTAQPATDDAPFPPADERSGRGFL